MAKSDAWKNRIVGTADVDPSTLAAHPLNFRQHPGAQANALRGSLDSLGWIQQVIVNRASGRMIDGHLRVELALKNGQQTVPVLYVDLTEQEEAQALMSLDPIAAMAATDKGNLEQLMRQVQTDDANVMEFIADLAEREKIILNPPDVQDAEPQVDKAEELRIKWGVESGQLWRLGDHLVICGDCTDRETVARLMGGERALVFSDPPYGIDVVGGGGTKLGKIGGGGPTKFGKVGGGNIVQSNTYAAIVGDDTTETARKFYETCIDVGMKDFILWGGNYFTDFLPPSRCWLVWDKKNTGNFADVELAWTSFDKVCKKYEWLWNGLSRQGNRDEELSKRVHPTQKPVGLHKMIMEDFQAEIYLDGFLGSGTTLIACERLARRCRGVEISPGYVAVTLERWATATGKTPELVK